MKLKQVPPGKNADGEEYRDYRTFLGKKAYLPRIQQMDLTTCGGCKITFVLNAFLAATLAAYVLV